MSLGAEGATGPSFPLLGEACALGAAIVWALALVLFKQSGKSVRPVYLNLFKNVVGLVLLGLTVPLAGESWEAAANLPRAHVLILLLSGLLGIAVADTLFFHALNLLGVGLVSVVDCVYTPCVFFFGWLLLGEQITLLNLLGAAMIISGVLISSRHAPPEGRTAGQMVLGALCGVAAMATMAFGIVYAKSVLETTPTFTATFIRMLAGTVGLVIFAAFLPDRAAIFSTFRPSAIWWRSVPAALLGSYLSMTLWVAGYKFADASVNALLNQTTVIFSLIFATLLLREPLTRRKMGSIFLAFAGVVVAKLGDFGTSG